MSEEYFPFIFIGASIIIVVSTIGFALWRWKNMTSVMQEFAVRHGLQYNAPAMFFISNPTLSGMIRGFGVNIYLIKKGSGKNSSVYTVLDVSLQTGKPFQFHIYEAGLISGLGKIFGMQDIEIGDENFDRKFVIKSSDPDMISSFLTPQVRDMFINAADKYTNWGVEFNGQKLNYKRLGTFSSAKIVSEFEDMMNVLCDLGEQLKSAR